MESLESLKEFGTGVLGDSEAVVLHKEAVCWSVRDIGGTADFDLAATGLIKVVDGIAQQVREDLFDGVRIAKEDREFTAGHVGIAFAGRYRLLTSGDRRSCEML